MIKARVNCSLSSSHVILIKIFKMNLLRQLNYCRALKLSHRSSLLSISLPLVPLHSDCTNSRYQAISSCAKVKSNNNLSLSLRNKTVLNAFQRSSSSQQTTVVHKHGVLNQLKSDIDPYLRLIRFDRPIGKYQQIMQHSSSAQNN